MSTCHNCGRAHVLANKRFCQYCGAAVGQTVTGSTLPGSSRPAGRLDRTPIRPLIVGGAILGVVVIVTVVLLVVHSRPTETAGTATASSGGHNSAIGQVPTESPPLVSTTDPVPTLSSEPTTGQADDAPATVVRNYYTAVNNRDFQTAWQLGGDNLGSSYTAFVDGYATTVSDELTVVDTIGDKVDVDLAAHWSDGTTHEYQGSYTVANGQIVGATLHKIS